uniref:Uncharacterized protein n=1 Tax=Chondria sp. (in: red algae) TaxID=1982705 RepID=A0A1Z1MQB0_9FLOR|nr:hypothetical protein [Chondria sp. (in: red algae)]
MYFLYRLSLLIKNELRDYRKTFCRLYHLNYCRIKF